MGFGGMLEAVHQGVIDTGLVRYRQYPAGAAGVAVADDAAWDELIASTVLTATYWLAGLLGFAPGAAADAEQIIADGSGGADGAAVAAATLLAEVQQGIDFTSGVGLPAQVHATFLPIPIQVAASTRNAGRISASPTGGVALTLSIEVITQGLGAA